MHTTTRRCFMLHAVAGAGATLAAASAGAQPILIFSPGFSTRWPSVLRLLITKSS